MRTLRLTQNFSGRRAIIWTAQGRTTEALEPTLGKLGFKVDVLDIDAASAILGDRTLNGDEDVLFVDGDLALPSGWREIGDGRFARAPVPVIGLVGIEAPSRLKALVQLDAGSFLSKPIYGGAVYSALFLAVNQFNRREVLEGSLANLFAKRRKRSAVVKAVLCVMERYALNEDDAYAVLRRESMKQRISVEDYCVNMTTIDSAGESGFKEGFEEHTLGDQAG